MHARLRLLEINDATFRINFSHVSEIAVQAEFATNADAWQGHDIVIKFL